MDWQSLTYAGHTVWNVNNERGSAEKRRPRSEWVIQRDTHPALITDKEAEDILHQLQRGIERGRRVRQSPLLLSGLLVSPDGVPWWSGDGGCYRLAKGKKVSATRLETAVLERISLDLQADETVDRILKSIRSLQGPRIDGRTLTGMERRISTLTDQIERTVDLASESKTPAPFLRRVSQLEEQRATLTSELQQQRGHAETVAASERITADDVRSLLNRFFTEFMTAEGFRPQGRQALEQLVEKVELDPESMNCRIHYAVQQERGLRLASPSRTELTRPTLTARRILRMTRRERCAA